MNFCNCRSAIKDLKRSFWKLIVFDRNAWYHITVCRLSVVDRNTRNLNVNYYSQINKHNLIKHHQISFSSVLKLIDVFIYLGSNISSTESDISILIAKAKTVIDRTSIIWKYDLSDKIKQDFLQAVAVWILLYWCTMRTLTKRIEKKLCRNYTIVHDVLNKSRKELALNTTVVRPLASHLTNHLNKTKKTCSALLEKQERIHKRRFSVDS